MKKYIAKLILLLISGLFAVTLQSQTLMPIPAATSTYSGNTRGMWFTAPCNFTIVGLRVPSNLSTANSYIAVMDFGLVDPPTYSATTNSFTILINLKNVAGTAMIPVNIPILNGHRIGILGCRSTPSLSMYSSTAPYPTTIDGKATNLGRLGMQYDLTSTAPVDLWNEASAAIAVTEMYYTVKNFKSDAGISAIDSPITPVSPAFLT